MPILQQTTVTQTQAGEGYSTAMDDENTAIPLGIPKPAAAQLTLQRAAVAIAI